MNLNVLEVGNRVDVSSTNKKTDDRNPKPNGDTTSITSEIRLFSSDYSVVIDMPKFQDKLVVLSDNTKYVFTFLSSNGSYRGTGTVTRRFKKNDRYFVEVTFENGIEKFQRREYFRLDCRIPATTFAIDKKGATTMSMTELKALVDPNSMKTDSGLATINYERLKNQLLSDIDNYSKSEPIRLDIRSTKEKEEAVNSVIILDISGGGARFQVNNKIEAGSFVVLKLSVEIDGTNTLFYLATEILKCDERIEGQRSFYECRSKFTNMGADTKKLLTKYIFDEDRKARTRGKV